MRAPFLLRDGKLRFQQPCYFTPQDAWYWTGEENRKPGTVDVGRFHPNHWGLFDMHGSVWEWCCDGARDYGAETAVNPMGAMSSGAGRVVRGGGWSFSARYARAASRFAVHSGYRHVFLGLRCALVPEAG